MAENNHPLAKYRRDHGLTQEALASKLGVWPLTVWRWEKGKRTPRRKVAEKIAEETGVSVAEILTGEAQPETAQ